MTYQEALDFLFPLHRFGIKPGFDRVQAMLDLFGSPQKHLGLVIHIAGTNGKGSVAAALASVFQASGRKTALYTSPHLLDFTERMRIDGKPISRDNVAHYCSRLKESATRNNATFFEVTTAIAFAWFADEAVEVSVIETGMGGRLDATSMVDPDYAVITGIGLDHTEWLGETLGLIAGEKAGIIKKGCKVFTAVTLPEALLPIQSRADSCGAPLSIAGRDALWTVKSAAPGALELSVRTELSCYPALKVPLTGSFHASNVTLAVMVAEDAGIGPEEIADGLGRILKTGYRARLEKISGTPTVLLDVSHNPDGIRATVDAIEAFRQDFSRISVVLGLASDKDAQSVIGELCRLDCAFYPVNIPSERSVPAEELGVLCRDAGASATVFNTGMDALGYLRRNAAKEELILVTGSFYLAGEIIAGGS
ncbi:MAG: folylpolyglutamate synthase/dihydrofolate synthase family protein [Chlorobiaceae bacterium]